MMPIIDIAIYYNILVYTSRWVNIVYHTLLYYIQGQVKRSKW